MLSSTSLAQDLDIKTPENRRELKENLFSNYMERIKSKEEGSKVIFSGSMLNSLFRGELGSFFTNTNDFALDSYFLTTDTDAKTLTIGMSKDLDVFLGRVPEATKKLYKLSHIGTLYTRSSIDKKFSSLTKRNSETDEIELNSGIGIGLKYTFLGRGSIRFDRKAGMKFEELRKELIDKKISKEIETYNSSKFLEELTERILDKKLDYLTAKNISYYEDSGVITFSSAIINLWASCKPV